MCVSLRLHHVNESASITMAVAAYASEVAIR